jgi:cytochrome c oxidase cbb3-type subunit II
MNFHKDHQLLVATSFLGFLFLSILIAIMPAAQLQKVQPLPAMEQLSLLEREGLRIYVEENCMACHTQQVRNIEMDKVWGNRPSLASDYYFSKTRMDLWRQSPSLLGSERTGPDLTSAGQRQPGKEWHLLHLFNPRIVVKESIMPSYPWLFEYKEESAVRDTDVRVAVPKEFLNKPGLAVVATGKALSLVAYLQSLKQAALPGSEKREFIPSSKKVLSSETSEDLDLDGQTLYNQHCAACHQSDGSGLVGAFPSLAGSSIVNNEDPSLLVQIILEGFDARTEFGVMQGFGDILSDEEIAAIVNHERKSWGNAAPLIGAEEVRNIRSYVKQLKQ